jgi:hypothetical protein
VMALVLHIPNNVWRTVDPITPRILVPTFCWCKTYSPKSVFWFRSGVFPTRFRCTSCFQRSTSLRCAGVRLFIWPVCSLFSAVSVLRSHTGRRT